MQLIRFNSLIKKYLPYISIFLLTSCIYISGNSQVTKKITFKHLSANEGLSSNRIHCITKDSYGYMWIGTIGGLNKYNGYNFKVYTHDPLDSNSIGSDYITAILEDNNKKIWVGCYDAGLYLYNEDLDNFIPFGNKENNMPINVLALAETSDGVLWIGSEDKGLQFYDRKNNLFINKGFKDEVVNNIFEDKNGKIWLSTSKNIYQSNSNATNFTPLFTNDNDISRFIEVDAAGFYQDKKNNIWICTRNGVLKFTQNSFPEYKHYNIESGLSHNSTFSLWEDGKNNIWISTSRGLNLLDTLTDSFHYYLHDDFDQSTINVNSLNYSFIDNADNTWIGTWSKGINYFNLNNTENKFLHYKKGIESNTLSNNAVNAITEDNTGNLWIGTVRGGLNYFNRQSEEFIHYKANEANSISQNIIHSLYFDKNDNSLWIGTFSRGLDNYNITANSFTNYKIHNTSNENQPEIFSILGDESNKLWIGTREGLVIFNKEQKQVIQIIKDDPNNTLSVSHNKVNFLESDNYGNVWIGTNKGLNVIDTNTFNIESYYHDKADLKSLGNNMIISIYNDRNNNMWIGTNGGLNLFNREDKTFKRYTTKTGLPNNVIKGILEDNSGNIWISTNKGLSKIKFNNDDIITEITNYTIEDGLQGNMFYFNSFCKTVNGDLIFGGSNGFNLFKPEKFTKNLTPPKVYFSDFKLFNESVQINKNPKKSPLQKHISKTSEIVLNHKQKNITFEFVAINYSHPEKNKYQCKLEGYDEKWIKLGKKKEATYTNLPPGDYLFKVKASNNCDIWNENGALLSITIVPPFWKRGWFITIIVIILITSVIIIIQYRSKLAKEEKQILEDRIKESVDQVEEKKQEIEAQNQALRQKQKEDELRNWASDGMAKFGDLLREDNKDLDKFSFKIISQLAKFLNAKIAGLFIRNDDNQNNIFYELKGAYAYEKKKLLKKVINIGEGLIGACAFDKKTIYYTDIPEGYVKISSGLGETPPKCILIIPCIFNDIVFGIIELASLEEFDEFRISFIEELGEKIASTISVVKNNERTNRLLEKSKEQANELITSEEELRQNLEEMRATQEQSAKREKELLLEVDELRKDNIALREKIRNINEKNS